LGNQGQWAKGGRVKSEATAEDKWKTLSKNENNWVQVKKTWVGKKKKDFSNQRKKRGGGKERQRKVRNRGERGGGVWAQGKTQRKGWYDVTYSDNEILSRQSITNQKDRNLKKKNKGRKGKR